MRPGAKALTNMLRQRHPAMGQGPMFGPAQQNPPQGEFFSDIIKL